MLKQPNYLILCFFTLLSIFSRAQDDFVDSLKKILDKNIHDTLRARIYIDLAETIVAEDEWFPFNKKALELANSNLKTSKGKERLIFLEIKANAIGNYGYYNDDHGHREKAIAYYFQSLELYDEAKKPQGKASILSNLGVIYTNQGDFKEALDYLDQALILKKKYEPEEIAKNYINIGAVYDASGVPHKALEYYQLGLEAATKIQDDMDMATCLNNIGSWHHKKKEYRKSIPFLSKAITHCLNVEDSYGAAWITANLGSSYAHLNLLDSSYYHLYKAKEISENFDYPELTQTIADKLFANYESEGKYEKALEMYKLSQAMLDTIQNVSAQKASIREKLAYDHNLEKATLKLQREEEQKREAQRFYFILAGFILAGIFGVIIYSRLRVTKRQKEVIEQNRDLIEEKNGEIMDSINYAKRLQDAILPNLESFTDFKDHFLLYLPKDIVAGDFYWLHKTKTHTLFAVADCTGHGVPGALVSVVCANALEHSIKENPNASTGELLDVVTEYIIKRFENDNTDVKDGMDIALCKIDKDHQRIEFSGAYNPLWIARNEEMIAIKGDRRPVGSHVNDIKFTTHEFDCLAGDWIYLFTDGYQDQFGGERGKKYKTGALKSLLVENSILDGKMQYAAYKQELESWRGNLEQIDDVCLLGVKI